MNGNRDIVLVICDASQQHKWLSINFRESLFLKIRILVDLYERGYFTSCVYVRTRVVYLACLLLSQMPTFEVEAMVHGYTMHTRIALIGEELVCAREPDNLRDPFAVLHVVKSDAALGGTLWRALLVDPTRLAPRILCILRLKFSNSEHSHGRRRT